MKRTILKRAIVTVSLVAVAGLAIADTTHVVQKGETLYSLSRTYGTTVQAICEANGIADGSSVQAGQKLTIPDGKTTTPAATAKTDATTSSAKTAASGAASAPAKSSAGTYVVQKGDTWYGIARTYGTNVNELYALNGVDNTATLKVGQKITVPGGTAVASAKSSGTEKSAHATVTVPKIEDPRTYSGKTGDSSLVWPVQKPAVTYISGKISGVNLSAKKDESVTAIRAGTVMFSGTYRGFGNVVFIQSKTGHIYAYTGLGTVKVNKGDYCVFGAQIGTAGVDSYTAKPQMSLMVFQNGLPIDPAKAPRG